MQDSPASLDALALVTASGVMERSPLRKGDYWLLLPTDLKQIAGPFERVNVGIPARMLDYVDNAADEASMLRSEFFCAAARQCTIDLRGAEEGVPNFV